MPRVQVPSKKAKARHRSLRDRTSQRCAAVPRGGVEHHLLGLARIGADEQHAAVAEPDMRHLYRHRHTIHPHDLVAPVELVRLARREAQRHVGLRHCRSALPPPNLGVPPHGVVAPLVAQAAQFLEHPDQRQPLPRRLPLVRQQDRVQPPPPRADPRQRLRATLIAKLRRLRADHLAHHLPRHPKLAADHLDRLLMNEKGAADLRDRLHNQHPGPGSPVPQGSHCEPFAPGVPIGRRSPRIRGPYSMPIHTRIASRGDRAHPDVASLTNGRADSDHNGPTLS